MRLYRLELNIERATSCGFDTELPLFLTIDKKKKNKKKTNKKTKTKKKKKKKQNQSEFKNISKIIVLTHV
jgi:hypothetical protein